MDAGLPAGWGGSLTSITIIESPIFASTWKPLPASRRSSSTAPKARLHQFQHIEAAVQVGADRADSVTDVLGGQDSWLFSPAKVVVSVSTRVSSY